VTLKTSTWVALGKKVLHLEKCAAFEEILYKMGNSLK